MSESTFINCANGGAVRVHVKDGKIIRIRPLVLNDTDAPSWTIKAHGKSFTPLRKSCLPAYVHSERAKVYSDNRIKYPMMRVDFDPKGERNTKNRGKSNYKRISWNEALDIVAGEMKRVREKYGPAAITSLSSSHHNWGNIGYRAFTWSRFFNTIGFTEIIHNPDTWEGWIWGAAHAYGFQWRLGIPEQYNLLEDGLKNSELIVHWGNDPDSTHGVYGGNDSNIWRLWLRDLGKKTIVIDPFCNYTAVVLADKWLAPRPGTDTALALAIAYTWIIEGTYDKEYVKNRTLGFGEFKAYVLGETDGIPKTAKWAEEECAIPARDIVALAREWASKRTALSAGTRGGESSICRQAYATEWARMMVLLQAMQGLGKPGVSIWGTTMGVPFNDLNFPGYASPELHAIAESRPINPVKQRLYRLLLPEAILNPPIEWYGDTPLSKSLEQQFVHNKYPMEGCPEVKLFYRYGGSSIGTMTETHRWAKMYQSPKIEFVVNQDCWWCTETKFADIILPACTNFERNDISEWGGSGGYSHHGFISCNHRIIIYQQKCIEPLWESRSDYDIFTDLAERLGVKEQYTEGNTLEDWIEKVFKSTDLSKYISFKELKTRGYYVLPIPENCKPATALRWFYEGRDCDTPDTPNPKINTTQAHELGTYSGKVEFLSQSLLKHFPDDDERPPLVKYIPSWEGHRSKLANKYPLQIISPHPRMSFHTQHDMRAEWMGELRSNRIKKDGYYWHVLRIHPSDAEPRGIKDMDIVKVYNDRGSVLHIAEITERIKPGVLHSFEGSSIYDPLEPGNSDSPDRGGCINLITPKRMISKNAPGMAPNSCLVEVSKWEVC